jgi:hypothetical protein
MEFIDALQSLARKLDIDYSDIANNDLFTLDDLKNYLYTACFLAWDFDSWDWSEHSKTTVLSSTDLANGYIDYPADIAPSSIYYLDIDGIEQGKKLHTSFKREFQNNPKSMKYYWAEFKRFVFFNPNICSVGSVLDIYGKKNLVKPVADTDLMPFSPDSQTNGFSGNDAIIDLAYAQALSSEKKKNPSQAKVEEARGYGILKILSDQLKKGRASEQPTGTAMFNVPDYFSGRRPSNDNNNIGRFNDQ